MVLIANVHFISNLIGPEEYNISRWLLLVSIFTLWQKTRKFEFRGPKKWNFIN